MSTNPICFLSVCSGMEAASVAWEPLGFKAVGFSEIEPFPAAILKHRFPNTPNYGDLTQHHTWPIEPGTIDLLVGGTPCQSFSVAGLRKGMSDPRGNLALTFLGLADRLRPRWIVWENVPGVLSSNGGRDFGAFLGALGQLGYGWAYRVLDAQHFGVPQRRRRVFVVATSSGDGRLAGEVLSLPEGLRGYLEARGKKGKGPASRAEGGVDADGGQGGILWNGSDQPNAERVIDKAGTLNCNQGQRGGYICPAVQPPIPIQDGREIEKKQNGFGIGNSGDPSYTIDTTGAQSAAIPDHKPIVIDRAAFKQGETKPCPDHDTVGTLCARDFKGVGNQFVQEGKCIPVSIPYRKAKRAQSDKDDESWVEGEVSNILNNFDLGDTRTTHAVVEPFAFTQNQREEVRVLGDKAGALSAAGGMHQTNYVANVAPTVTSSGPPYSRTGNERVEAEAVVVHPAVTTCTGQRQGCSAEAMASLSAMNNAGAHPTMAVRRLTPVECERLQGFPDNWSRIPWKGKPETECPDGPRYKACGNSMAVPVMRWIGKRILEVEARQAAKEIR